MARRSAHIPKTALPAGERAGLPRSAFAVPGERKYPIHDLYHARLALIYVLSPSNAAYRDEVVGAVLARYPELKFWWAARSRRLAAPARRKVANPSPTSENTMPVSKRNNPRLLPPAVGYENLPENYSIPLWMGMKGNEIGWRIDQDRKTGVVTASRITGGGGRRMVQLHRGYENLEGTRAPKSVKALLAHYQRLAAAKENPATAYNVYLGTKHIDTVFQSGTSSADEVRRALINHDGYDRRIRVTKARRNNPRHEVETEAYFAAMEPTRAKYASRSPEELVLVRSRAAKMLRKFAGKSDREVAKALGLDPRDPAVLRQIALMREHAVVTNPAKRGKAKRTGGRTAAQSNAAKAMRLFHSGKASSLAEAWAMLRR